MNTEADSFETVRDGVVETEYYVPCEKIRMTYEPASGAIEVYASNLGMRRDVARAFADTIMNHEIKGETIPIKDYDLESFKTMGNAGMKLKAGIERVSDGRYRLRRS